jgi:peptidoglycan hydrolase CwlO-like protein
MNVKEIKDKISGLRLDIKGLNQKIRESKALIYGLKKEKKRIQDEKKALIASLKEARVAAKAERLAAKKAKLEAEIKAL